MSQPFLTAEWRHLAMFTYEAPADVLAPHVPPGTELDRYEGRALASFVGFQFLRTRLLGVPVPLHGRFEEVNLRTYVRRRDGDGWRRGVAFIRELVPRRLVACVANRVYHEHYRVLPMRHVVDPTLVSTPESDGAGREVSYSWRHGGRWHGMSCRARGSPALPTPGSIEEFLTENYWGFTALPNGGCHEFRVEHPPWRIWSADEASFSSPVAELFGSAWVEPLSRPPCSVLVADGSPVKMFTRE